MKIVHILLIFCFIVPFSQLYSQTVKVEESEEKPYLLNSEGENYSDSRGLFSRKSKKKLSGATSTYLLVHLGPSGTLEGLSASELARTGLQKELKFPTLNFTISAASKLLIKSVASGGKIKKKARSFTELRQLGMSIKVTGLNKSKVELQRVSKKKFGDDPITALSIFPSDTSYGQSKTPGIAQRAADKVDALAQHLGPIGGIAGSVTAVFRTLFPAKDHINQIAYMDSVNEFGWIWRESEGSPIEGIHKCMVLLRAHKEVKFLKVRVKIVTDWKRFGAWVKTYHYTIPVKESSML
ncbi:MAG: hypothetical protein ABFR75_02020 [Acidobacteriota bacterium]